MPTVIFPLRFNYPGGKSFDATPLISRVLQSPLFSDFAFPPPMANQDFGQYGEVSLRAQFNVIGSSYRVRRLPRCAQRSASTFRKARNSGFSSPALPSESWRGRDSNRSLTGFFHRNAWTRVL